MLINLDLAGAEWVVTAYLSRDPEMLKIAKSKESPHPVTGARISGVSKELVIKDDKVIGLLNDPAQIYSLRKQHLPELLDTATFLPRTMSIRQAAKKANHGLNYRLGYKTFALKNEMEERDAIKIVELYRRVAYPGLLKWYDRIDAKIRKDRTMENCFGRKLYFMGQIDDDTFREATAFVPQSTVVDIVNTAMPKLLNDDSKDFAPAKLLAQVHDSLLTDYVSTDFRAMARYAIKLALDYMSPTLDYGEPFKLDTELKAGLDWGGTMKKIKLTNDEEYVAESLKKVFYDLGQKAAA
jgi:DNA polymerase I-like protein with 3'-5' exonuclease and polymerase domains